MSVSAVHVIPFTRKQLEQVAREVGFRGALIGSVTRIAADIDAWITRNNYVPTNPSSVLSLFLERHGFSVAKKEEYAVPLPPFQGVVIENPRGKKRKYFLPDEEPEVEEGDTEPVVPRHGLALTMDQLMAINSKIREGHSLAVIPTDEGIRLRVVRNDFSKSHLKGRMAVKWTQEERVEVEKMRERIQKMSLQQRLDLAKTLPLPKHQTKKFPGFMHPTLFHLYKEISSDGKKCSDRICKMRITVLLLKWAASQVSGRKIYY